MSCLASELVRYGKHLAPSILVMLVAGCSFVGTPKSVGPPLTGAEIKKLIVGNTIQGPLGPAVFDWYYANDTKVSGDVGLEDKDTGTWRIKDSKIYCHRWTKFFGGVERCYEWFKINERDQYILKSTDGGRVDHLEVWEIIIGNPYNM